MNDMGAETPRPDAATPSIINRDITRRALICGVLGLGGAALVRNIDPFGLTDGAMAKGPEGQVGLSPEFPVTHTEYFTDVDPKGYVNLPLRLKLQDDPILAARFRPSVEQVRHIEAADEAVAPASRVYLPFVKRSGNGPVITQTPRPTSTEAPLPTNTPPFPTVTSTPNPTETAIPPTATPEVSRVIEQNWPLPGGAPLLRSPHAETTWTTAEHAQAETGTVVDILQNGMVTVLVTDPYDGETKTVFANPIDIGLDPNDIDKGMIDVPLVVREIVSPKKPVKINATDGSYRAQFPGNQMRNGTRPVDFHFDMTLEPKPGSTDATAAFIFEGVTYDSSNKPSKLSGCSVLNINGNLFLAESNYNYRTGKLVRNTYDLKIAGMRTDAVLRVTDGTTLTFFLPEWDEVEQKYNYQPHATIPLSAPIEEDSIWDFGPGALNATVIYDKVTMTAVSNIDNVDAFAPDPTRNEEKIKEYLPDHMIGITDPEPTESPRMNNKDVMENASVVDTTNATFGYNKWRLGALLLGNANDGIKGFPFSTIQKADFYGQSWHPSVDATGIAEFKSIPAKYLVKEGRDEYITAVVNFAIGRDNHKALILDGHFNAKGEVANDWVDARAASRARIDLLKDEITTIHSIDPERGIIFKLPRDFKLSRSNTDGFFATLDQVRDELKASGQEPKIEGLYTYLQGSTPAEIRQFLAQAAEHGLTIHAFGLADRSQNKRLSEKSTPVEVMKPVLDDYDVRCKTAFEQGGSDMVSTVTQSEIIFDSDHEGGYDNDPDSVEIGTQYLIERKNDLEYEYGPLHEVVLQFVKDRHLSKAA